MTTKLIRFTNFEARNEVLKNIKRCGFDISESFKFNIDLTLNIIRNIDQTKVRQQFNFWMPSNFQQTEILNMILEGVYFINNYKIVLNTNLKLVTKNIAIYKADDHMNLVIYKIDNGIINEIHTAYIPFQLCYSNVQLMHNDFYIYYDEGKSMLTGFFSRDNLSSFLTKPVEGFSINKFVNRIENEIKWIITSIKVIEQTHKLDKLDKLDKSDKLDNINNNDIHNNYNNNYNNYNNYNNENQQLPPFAPIMRTDISTNISANNRSYTTPLLSADYSELYSLIPSAPNHIPHATAPPTYEVYHTNSEKFCENKNGNRHACMM